MNERVLRTFGRIPGKADRVPIQFEMCQQLTDHFSKELGIPAHYTENLYEDVTFIWDESRQQLIILKWPFDVEDLHLRILPGIVNKM